MSRELKASSVLEGGFQAEYRWAAGAIIGRFLQALRDGPVILGSKCSECGRVASPPADICSGCGALSKDLIPIGSHGVIVAHAAVSQPITGVHRKLPFAFVLVRLDGSDTAMAHVAPGVEGCALRVGDRVQARFRSDRQGTIDDIEGFIAESELPGGLASVPAGDSVEVVKGQLDIPFRYSYGLWFSRFYEELQSGRIMGVRCPTCHRVLLPPRPMCGSCFCDVEPEPVLVSDHGYVRTFTRVQMPYVGQPLEPPYNYALIVLDGADGELHHIVENVEPERMRVGLRVEAKWLPPSDRQGTFHDIKCFIPEA